MLYRNIFLSTLVLLIYATVGFSQTTTTYKTGDKVLVMVNGKWTKAIILNGNTGNVRNFRIQLTASKASGQSIITVGSKELRLDTEASAPATMNNAAEKINTTAIAPYLGRYEIYTGIQKNHIGNFYLSADGTYKVALSSDENSYAQGTYRFNAEDLSIQWLTGLFSHNRWDGKTVRSTQGGIQIIFTGKAMAEKVN